MLHCAMTNALTDITALAQSAGRIRLVWVWALQWSWKTAHLAFALTLYLAKRICSAQVVAVTPGSAGVFVVHLGKTGGQSYAQGVTPFAVKALRLKGA